MLQTILRIVAYGIGVSLTYVAGLLGPDRSDDDLAVLAVIWPITIWFIVPRAIINKIGGKK